MFVSTPAYLALRGGREGGREREKVGGWEGGRAAAVSPTHHHGCVFVYLSISVFLCVSLLVFVVECG